MSGPIVRRYGFPNFEKIFGERELQHGVDEPETEGKATAEDSETAPKSEAAKSKPKAKKKKS